MTLLIQIYIIAVTVFGVNSYFAATWGRRQPINPQPLKLQQSNDDNSNVDQPFEPQYNVDIFGDIDSADEELLEKMRNTRQYVNDGWQSRLFRDNLVGSWKGKNCNIEFSCQSMI